MEVSMSVNKTLYHELVTTDYATAKLIADIHKETSVLINYHTFEEHDKPVTFYHVNWRKDR